MNQLIGKVPVGVSNRHIHLSAEDLETLFGPDYELTPIKDLSQTGQFAADEKLTIVTPKNAIQNVRVLGRCVPKLKLRFHGQMRLLSA